MDKLWLKENLDLKMVTFSCVPTGDRQGMLEMITEAKTLREIQVIVAQSHYHKLSLKPRWVHRFQVTGNRGGVTGSFRDTSISDWLEVHNPSQLEFGRAVMNFTRK